MDVEQRPQEEVAGKIKLRVLGRVLDLLGTHQEKVICKLGPGIPLIGRELIDTILARCDCSDSLDEAIKYLKEDC